MKRRSPHPPARPASQVSTPVSGAEAGSSNAAAAEALREHTVFVRGTFSDSIEEREGRYFEPGMMESANDFFGSETSSEFDWFGGPLSGASRDLAGRKLLREEVMPAFARDEKVNLVAHSHGGNVLGEMAAHYEARMAYLSTLIEGTNSPSATQEALDAIVALRTQRRAELEHFEGWIGSRALDDSQTQLVDLRQELDALGEDVDTLFSGDSSRFEEELLLLQSGQFGDVMNLNTPYLNRHEAVTEVEPFADRVEQFTDVIGTRDPTAFLGRLHESMVGGLSRTLPDHERVQTLTWDLEDPGLIDKRRHTGVLEEAVFNRAVLGPLSD